MDLVTVTYSYDINLLRLQANSIDRYIQKPCVHWVIIEDDVISMEQWEQVLRPYYTKHKLMLVKNNLSLDARGWIRQQVLKLTIAEHITSEYYLILDSKTFFIRPIDLENYPLDEGDDSVFTRKDILNEKWGEWLSHIESITGRKKPDKFWRVYPPFKMKTSTVQKMLKEINIIDLFGSSIKSQSEFLLYGYYSEVTPTDKVKNHYRFQNNDLLPSYDELQTIKADENILTLAIHQKLIDGKHPNLIPVITWLLNEGFDKIVITALFR